MCSHSLPHLSGHLIGATTMGTIFTSLSPLPYQVLTFLPSKQLSNLPPSLHLHHHLKSPLSLNSSILTSFQSPTLTPLNLYPSTHRSSISQTQQLPAPCPPLAGLESFPRSQGLHDLAQACVVSDIRNPLSWLPLDCLLAALKRTVLVSVPQICQRLPVFMNNIITSPSPTCEGSEASWSHPLSECTWAELCPLFLWTFYSSSPLPHTQGCSLIRPGLPACSQEAASRACNLRLQPVLATA